MNRRWPIILAMILTLGIAMQSVASAATPKKHWYWSESRAESIVLQKVKIPDCWFSDDNRCANPPGPFWANGGPRWKLQSADCTGADEYRSSFKFRRFTCKIVVADYYGRPLANGVVAVYPTGPMTLRWKLLD